MAKVLLAPDWMKVDEVAAILRCDRKTVRNRLASGNLPVRTVHFGRTLRLNRDDVQAFLNSTPYAKSS